MGQGAALKALRALGNAQRVVALEYLAAAQGLEFLRPLRPGLGPRAAYRQIRRFVPRLEGDRALAADADAILDLMSQNAIVAAAERAVGRLADVSRP
jgi:histidine ammonia-lyase